MASFVMPIVSGLAGLLGGLGSKTMTQTTNGTTTNSGSSSGSSSTTPQLSDLQQLLSSIFGPAAVNLYSQSTNLQPYAENAIQQNNNTANAASTSIANNLAARGIAADSPYAAFISSQPTLQKQAADSQVLSGLPLLQNQLQQQSIGTMTNAFGALPTGSSSTSSGTTNNTSTTNGTTKTTAPGNILSAIAGGISGAGSAYAAQNQNNILNQILQSLQLG